MDILSPNDVLGAGLGYLKIKLKADCPSERKNQEFHANYGSSPLVLATQWFDLIHADLPNFREKDRRGFHMFMTAHHFLWAYPRNAKILAAHMGISIWAAGRDRLWTWIGRIAALKDKVIFWPDVLNLEDSEVQICTLDGTDFRVWEIKNAIFTVDRKQFSKKFAHGALKYMLVVAVHHQKCIHIYGPCRGGESDKTMLEDSGVLNLIREGKLALVDRGYINVQNKEKLAWPNPHHTPEANNFQSRARLRHETFNGRLKFFGSLNQTFRHGQGHLFEKHKLVLEAVAVTVQYQLDNGSPLFEV
jgi:hypothetical protein